MMTRKTSDKAQCVPDQTGKKDKKKDTSRQQRLEQALRDNLRRRKQQEV